MRALLEHIRPMLAAAEARVEVLRELERLAAALDAGAGDGTAPIPDSAAAARLIEADGAAPRSGEGANGAGVAVELETGSNPGRNGADAPGARSSAPGSGPSVNGHAPRSPHVPPPDSRPGREGIRWALEQLGEGTATQIAALTKTDPSTVAALLRRFLDDEVVRVGLAPRANGTNGRRPGLFALKSVVDQALRERPTHRGGATTRAMRPLTADVEQAIRENPAGITEPDIADSIGLDREDVAVACGTLLDQGRVHLRGDGGYVAVWK